ETNHAAGSGAAPGSAGPRHSKKASPTPPPPAAPKRSPARAALSSRPFATSHPPRGRGPGAKGPLNPPQNPTHTPPPAPRPRPPPPPLLRPPPPPNEESPRRGGAVTWNHSFAFCRHGRVQRRVRRDWVGGPCLSAPSQPTTADRASTARTAGSPYGPEP